MAINKKLKKCTLVKIQNNPEPNLLPWYCLNFIKKKYKDKYLEKKPVLWDYIKIWSINCNVFKLPMCKLRLVTSFEIQTSNLNKI